MLCQPGVGTGLEAVIIFLDDKGAIPISQALERLLYREELRTRTRSKLIDVIDDVIATIPNAEEERKIEIHPEERSEGPSRVVKLNAELDASTKERIVKKIFSRDYTQFDHIVQEILQQPPRRDAAGALDRWFARQGVAPDSAAAMEFAQALHRSYV